MGHAVVVDGLNVVRGDNHILHDISLDVPSGRILGLLGPSGCGKTTFMRCIVGVQQITSGSVTVLGSPAGTASLRERIGYVTQAPAVYEDLTVESRTSTTSHACWVYRRHESTSCSRRSISQGLALARSSASAAVSEDASRWRPRS
jgi:ABC-type Fe3+/spermidine/putrescine transport system ATPase subunit